MKIKELKLGTYRKARYFPRAVFLIARRLKGRRYAIRGTMGLALQGIKMGVTDIDIICDKETALACNQVFKDYLVKKIEYQESPQFRSFFGQLKMQGGVEAEVMGEWEVKDPKGRWINYHNFQRKRVSFEGKIIWVTTIEQELNMFAAMGRWRAYHLIRKQFKEKGQEDLFSISS